MPTVYKYFTIVAIAIGITLAVFYLMHRLIDGPVVTPGDGQPPVRVVFSPVEIPDDPPKDKDPLPDKPEPREPPPDVPDIPTERIVTDKLELTRYEFEPASVGDGLGFVTGTAGPAVGSDAGPQRLVALQPPYPREAAMAGIEGWVRVQFTVTEAGTVRDIRILDAAPSRVFNETVINTLQRWRFEPARVDGQPVARRVVQVLEFDLDRG